jgi:AcrR family transcriptional regulator
MDFNEKQFQIMEAALAEFAEKGFENASVRDVAKRADVNVAMISYYFGSKEKLLEALFKNHMEKMKMKISSIIHSKDHDPFEKVNLLIDTYIDVVMKNRDFHGLMMRERLLLRDGPMYDYMRDMKKQNLSLLESAVKSGQKAGFFQKKVDVMMLSTTLLGSINQALSNRKFICDVYKIKEEDGKAFNNKVIQKLRGYLKIIFKSYLTNNISNE